MAALTLDRPTANAPDLLALLIGLAGPDAVKTDLAERTFFSTDIAASGAVAEAVVCIGDVGTLSRVVRACTELGHGVVPRGGGFSYTGGYTPDDAGAVILDLRGLDRIVEINTEDMYVVVEAGCTWERLYEALKAKGVRTPYFGPMSGYRATVGGALSQGSFFLGSSQYGAVSDSVLGLEVVLADGTVLNTGSGASGETPPYFRQYGPDATGLFLNDTGAMGFKTKAVLRLIPFPARQAYGSFAFTSHRAAVAAVSEIGRSGLAAECYCWDPFFVTLMAAASTGFKQDLGLLMNVIRNAAGPVEGLLAAARLALAGRSAFKGDTWLMHVVIDDATAAGAAGRLKRVRGIARRWGGRAVAPTAPMALRGTPFIDFNTSERRMTRRNLPVNSLSPHSRAATVADEVYRFLADNEALMRRDGVQCGVIFFALGGQAVCIEPLLYWEDEQHFQHDRVRETTHLEALAGHPDRPQATRTAFGLRQGLKDLFRRHGCLHVQIGRAYPWRETREAAALALITTVKDAVDPRRLVNRGSLGFGPPADD